MIRGVWGFFCVLAALFGAAAIAGAQTPPQPRLTIGYVEVAGEVGMIEVDPGVEVADLGPGPLVDGVGAARRDDHSIEDEGIVDSLLGKRSVGVEACVTSRLIDEVIAHPGEGSDIFTGEMKAVDLLY